MRKTWLVWLAVSVAIDVRPNRLGAADAPSPSGASSGAAGGGWRSIRSRNSARAPSQATPVQPPLRGPQSDSPRFGPPPVEGGEVPPTSPFGAPPSRGQGIPRIRVGESAAGVPDGPRFGPAPSPRVAAVPEAPAQSSPTPAPAAAPQVAPPAAFPNPTPSPASTPRAAEPIQAPAPIRSEPAPLPAAAPSFRAADAPKPLEPTPAAPAVRAPAAAAPAVPPSAVEQPAELQPVPADEPTPAVQAPPAVVKSTPPATAAATPAAPATIKSTPAVPPTAVQATPAPLKPKNGVSDFDPPPFSVDDEPAPAAKPSPRSGEPGPLPLGNLAEPEQLSPPRATVPLKAAPTPAPARIAPPAVQDEPQPLGPLAVEPAPVKPKATTSKPIEAEPKTLPSPPKGREPIEAEPLQAVPQEAAPIEAEPLQAEPAPMPAATVKKPAVKPAAPKAVEAEPTPAAQPEEAAEPILEEAPPAKPKATPKEKTPAATEKKPADELSADAMEAEPTPEKVKPAPVPSKEPEAEGPAETEQEAPSQQEPEAEAPAAKRVPPVQIRPRVFANFGVAGPDGKSEEAAPSRTVEGESLKELLGSETAPPITAKTPAAGGAPTEADSGGEAKAAPSGEAKSSAEPPAFGSAEPKGEAGPKKRPKLLETLSPDLIRPESAEPIYDDPKGASGGKPKRDADLPELTAETTKLGERVREARELYQQRIPNTKDHTHHDVLQHILGYGVAAELRIESSTPKVVNAIAYECYNNLCRGEELLFMERNAVAARKAARAQTHYGQYLAVLAQSGVALDYPLKVKGKTFTVADLVETEKRDCESNMELSFKLLALSYYVGDSDETWRNGTGQDWNLERLIREEIAAPVVDEESFGGTQRLLALSAAVRRRQGEGKPLDGQFGRAAKYVSDFHRYTLTLQNTDGSFSTEFFKKKSAEGDAQRKLTTTGMVLEWLVFSLDRRDLDHPLIVRGMNCLTDLLLKNPEKEWDAAALGHALHALRVYEERFLAPAPGAAANQHQTAQRPAPPAAAPPAPQRPVAPAPAPQVVRSTPAPNQNRAAGRPTPAPPQTAARSAPSGKSTGKPTPAPLRTADRLGPHSSR